MIDAPWHVKGIRPEARDLALDAARRSGLSVGEWLNSLIIDAEDAADPRQAGGTTRQDPQKPDRTDNVRFVAIRTAVEELKRRIDDLSESKDRSAQFPRGATPTHIAETTARIDRQLESLRSGGEPVVRKHGDGIDDAFAEIAARQQALDAESAGSFSDLGARRETAIDPARIELQLRTITDEIKGLRGSCRAEGIARSVENAAPRQAIEAVERELRQLTSRLEAAPGAAALDQVVDSLRRDIADVSRRLDSALPQRAGASVEERIRALSDEIAKLNLPTRAEDIADLLRPDLMEIRTALQHATQYQDATAIKEQVRALTQEVAKRNPPLCAEDVAEALRRDLAEVGAALRSAMPTSAISALEQEVRTLNARIEANRASQPDSPVAAGLEQALAEIRDRLRTMAPAEHLAALIEAVKELSRKADVIAAQRPSPDLLRQLEQAIASLHDLASKVASQDAVAVLSRDIRGLAEQIDRGTRRAADTEFMSSIDQRLAEMTEILCRGRPAENAPIAGDLDLIVKRLTDRLEAIQVPAADATELKKVEQRIVALAEKIDASQTRLGRLDSVERGMDDFLLQLKELGAQNERKLQAIQHQLVTSAAEAIGAPAEAIRRDVATLKEIQSSADRRTQDTFEAVYGTIEEVVDRLATIEQALSQGADGRQRPPVRDAAGTSGLGLADAPSLVPGASPGHPDRGAAGEASAAPQPRPDSKTAAEGAGARTGTGNHAERHPVMSGLAPDAPLEPGSGARRVRIVANAVDRIAASEAANAGSGVGGPLEATPAPRAGFVAAARRAAKLAAHERPGSANELGEKAASFKAPSPPRSPMQRIGHRIKRVVLGIGLILLVLGALRLSLDLFGSSARVSLQPPTSDETSVPPAVPHDPDTPADAPPPGKGAALSAPAGSSLNATLLPGEAALGAGPISGAFNGLGLPASAPGYVPNEQRAVEAPLAGASAAATAARDMTGSVAQATPSGRDETGAAPEASAARPAARDRTEEFLPAAIGSKALIAAAGSGDPGASYEVASRYAEGRNVPQDLPMAAHWFERAAQSDMAPAQFRLGTMYEKGLGLKKDLQEARRLYLAAADRGNAKAMHNLAVLYAEGIDGKPDYAAAAQWFRRAAACGLVDSEYNLAILYARGVGVERNLTESYKWFALAAKGGDEEAGRKRDDIAGRLAPPQLVRAKQAADAFMPERQPEEATATKAPPGGWDDVAAPAQVNPATQPKPKIGRQRVS